MREGFPTPEELSSLKEASLLEGESAKGQIKEIEAPAREIIDFRFKQSRSSRLAEYITGLKPNDPKMAERLIADVEIIRAKYQLPQRDMRYQNPSEYERLLREKAEEIGVRIIEKSDCGKFFDKNAIVSGVSFDREEKIGISIKREDREQYSESLAVLEHELIHALQDKYSARMPIEQREYEAYLAGANPGWIRNKRENVDPVIFGFMIQNSVDHWYKSMNERREEGEPEIKPVWDSPEYFLSNVDHVDPTQIEAYKQQLASRTD